MQEREFFKDKESSFGFDFKLTLYKENSTTD
jgi:hypothetical protein